MIYILHACYLKMPKISHSQLSNQWANSAITNLSVCILLCAMLRRSVVFNSCNPMDYSPPGSSVHVDSSGKNTGVGCHSLLQGIFLIQGSNSGLLQCRQILYHLSHREGSPNKLITNIIYRQVNPACNYTDITAKLYGKGNRLEALRKDQQI